MLDNFRKRIAGQGEAVIVYLGGSITEGQGVEDKRLCWQGLLQSELEKAYPECIFSAFNAGIGGTDSRFGAFRMERDVLCRRPDLLFVEFAVNDYTRPAQEIRESLEGILSMLWRALPECDVFFVLTATGKMHRENSGGLPESVRIHKEVAARYKIPWVNVGRRLFSRVEEGIALEELLPDGVHPNRQGYRIYFEGVWESMKRILDGRERGEKPEEVRSIRMETGREEDCSGDNPEDVEKLRMEISRKEGKYTACGMVPACRARLQGFVTEHIAMCGKYGSYVSSNRPGDFLEFGFRGDKIGLFYMISSDGGRMEWALDGGDFKELSAWDVYARSFDRGSAGMLAENLEPGEHRLCIRVAAEKDAESRGNFIRISDFLV
ncbi:MAG TPA: hypothetical protein DCZ91_02375 [Lachnospiraceae bacterium]|nr:hypothetical protein [Lachnospiraceae bacterium]